METTASATARPSKLKGRKFPVEILTRVEIDDLLRACNEGVSGHRNRALIVALWRGALRVSEALNLEVKDLNLKDGILRVLHGKGDKAREVALDQKTCAFLQGWLAARSKIPAVQRTQCKSVFCSLRGTKILPSQVRSMMTRLGKAALIDKRVHPHSLRHSAAYDMLREGVRLDIIQKQLGHSHLNTTARYIAHVTNPEVCSAIQARVW